MLTLAGAARRIDWSSIGLWLGLLALLVVAAVVAVVLIRRAIRAAEGTSATGFTLQDLREMRSRGELTEEEYQSARTIALGQAAGSSQGGNELSDSP